MTSSPLLERVKEGKTRAAPMGWRVMGSIKVVQKSTESAPAPRYPSSRYAWFTVGLLLVVYTFSFIDRQILGILGPTLQAEFEISDTEFGWLTGPAFALFYTAFGLYCARLSDRSNRKRLIAIGLALWSLMTALSAGARSFASLFALRVGVGVGEATLGPAANSLISDSFPKNKLATALSVYAMGIPVGSALAFIAGGAVISLADQLPDIVLPGIGALKAWQKTFLLVGLPGLLLTGFVLALKEPERKGVAGAGEAFTLSETLSFMKSRWKALVGIMVGVSCTSMLGFGSAIWLTTFFARVHEMPPGTTAPLFGAIGLISGPLGLMLGGLLADRWVKQGRKDAHVRALLIAPIGYLLPSLLAFSLPSEQMTLIWTVVFVYLIFVNLPSGVAFAALQVITPNQARGQVVATYILATNILGYGGGPLLMGYLSDTAFDGTASIGHAIVAVAAITTPIAILLLLWCRKAFAAAVVAEEERQQTEQA